MRNIIITRSFIFLNRKIKRLLLLLVTIFLCARMMGETIIPDSISNPIRTGFHPDPSICRVGEDYYLVTSSFTWFPGLPIYHSRDLTNWSLIGHALTNPKAIDFNGMTDNDGIWAPTLRALPVAFQAGCRCLSRCRPWHRLRFRLRRLACRRRPVGYRHSC